MRSRGRELGARVCALASTGFARFRLCMVLKLHGARIAKKFCSFFKGWESGGGGGEGTLSNLKFRRLCTRLDSFTECRSSALVYVRGVADCLLIPLSVRGRLTIYVLCSCGRSHAENDACSSKDGSVSCTSFPRNSAGTSRTWCKFVCSGIFSVGDNSGCNVVG